MSKCVKKVKVGEPGRDPVSPYEEWRDCNTTKTCKKIGNSNETIQIPCRGKERWRRLQEYQYYKLVSTCQDCVVDGSMFKEYTGDPFWEKENDAVCVTDPSECVCPDGYFS